jgi:hypothetical protein
MDLLEQTPPIQDLEVATNGHVRHAEIANEIGDAHATLLAHALKDQVLAQTS